MACGPALAGILQANFKIYKLTINKDTLPGWVMAAAWLVYLVWLWISFKEPSREENHVEPQSTAGSVQNDELEKGIRQPLLLTSDDNHQDDDDDMELYESEEASEESRLPATSIASAYRLLTPSVKSDSYNWWFYWIWRLTNMEFLTSAILVQQRNAKNKKALVIE
ncbi:hypothetical protein Ancab_014859 [Ancistrocladus abbreviatus]